MPPRSWQMIQQRLRPQVVSPIEPFIEAGEGDGDLDVSPVLIDAGLANPHRVPVGNPSQT